MARKLKEYKKEQEIRLKNQWPHGRVKVFAYAEDSETPYVIIKSFDYDGNLDKEIWLEDFYAQEVADKIQKALAILPTSK